MGMNRYEKMLHHQKSGNVTTGIGRPQSDEGASGDITIRDVSGRMTLFAKYVGRWYPVNLGESLKLGETHLTHLDIGEDGIHAMDGEVSISHFGKTLRIGQDGTSTSAFRVAGDGAISIGTSATSNFAVSAAGVVSITTGDLTLTPTAGTVAAGDQFLFLDENDSDSTKRAELSTLATLFAGTGLTASSSVISVDDVALGTKTSGNYVATITGGTGLTSTAATSGEGTTHSLSVDANQAGITSIGPAGTLTVNQDLTVTGNFLVSGDTVTTNVATVSVEDPLMLLANGNTSADSIDIGFIGLCDPSGSQDTYTGLFRDASDTKWKLFHLNQAAPTTTVNTSGTGYAIGTLIAHLEDSSVAITGGSITGITDLVVADGGTGASSFSTKAVVTSNDSSGTAALESKQMDGSGELLIGGSSGPEVGTITADDGLAVTVGDGTIELDLDLKSNGGAVIESNKLAVDLGASSITGTLAVGDGGTGLTTVGANYILTGNSGSALTAESGLTFSGTALTLVDDGTMQSSSFASGFTGHGWRILDSSGTAQGAAASGNASATFDTLSVRGTMSVYEMLIQQIRATNGSLIVSSAAKVESVANYSSGTDEVGQITFESTVSGSLTCPFVVNDIIMSQRVDVNAFVPGDATYNGSNIVVKKVLKVTAVSANVVTTGDAGFTSGTAPVTGDEFVRIGNTGTSDANVARQGILYLTSDDEDAPFIDVKSGVNTYAKWDAAVSTKVRIGKLKGITGVEEEYGLWAGVSGTNYLKATSVGLEIHADANTYTKYTGTTIEFYDDGNKAMELTGSAINIGVALQTATNVDAINISSDGVKIYGSASTNFTHIDSGGVTMQADTNDKVTVGGSGMTVYNGSNGDSGVVASYGADTVITGGSITLQGTTGAVGHDKIVIGSASIAAYANQAKVLDIVDGEINIGPAAVAGTAVIHNVRVSDSSVFAYGDHVNTYAKVSSAGLQVYKNGAGDSGLVATYGANTLITGGTVTIQGTTGTIGHERLVLEDNALSMYANNQRVFFVEGSSITLGETGGGHAELSSSEIALHDPNQAKYASLTTAGLIIGDVAQNNIEITSSTLKLRDGTTPVITLNNDGTASFDGSIDVGSYVKITGHTGLIDFQAGGSNSSSNICIGNASYKPMNALDDEADNDDNIAIGDYTLHEADNATDNVAIGNGCMRYMGKDDGSTTAALNGGNVAIGLNCLQGLAADTYTRAWNNVAIGVSAMEDSARFEAASPATGTDDISECRENVAIGFKAGYRISGAKNSFLGMNSGYGGATGTSTSSTIGYGNVAMGFNSFTSYVAGSYNVAIGMNAGTVIGDGTYNVCLGYDAEVGGAGHVNTIAIGKTCTGKGSNTANIGNDDVDDVYMGGGGATVHCGQIGIGTSSPDTLLEVAAADASAADAAIRISSDDAGNAELQFGNRDSVDRTVSKCMLHFATSNSHFRGDLLFCMQDTGDASAVASTDEVMRITSAGNVGIGTAAPASLGLTVSAGNSPPTGNASIVSINCGDDSTFASGLAMLHIKNSGNRGAMGHASGSNLLRCDYSDVCGFIVDKNGNVGIGTESPVTSLDISEATGGRLSLSTTDSGNNTIESGDALGYIQFRANDTGISASSYGCFIKGIAAGEWGTADNANDSPGELQFFTQNDGVGDGTAAARLVIDRDGNVNISKGASLQTVPVLGIRGTSTGDTGQATQVGIRWEPGVYGSSGNRGAWEILSAADNECTMKLWNDGGGETIRLIGDSAYAYFPGGGDWADIASDERVKKNIEDYTGGLDVINSLKPKQFKWNMDFENNRLVRDTATQIGWTAQSMQEVYPKWVSNTKDTYEHDDGSEVEDVLTVGLSGDFNAMLVSAVQELSAKVTALEAQI